MSEPTDQETDAPAPAAASQEWAELAASLSKDKGQPAAGGAPAESPAGRTPAAEPPAGLQRAVFSSSLALLLAFIAIMVAGMLWWQYRQFYVSLDETDAAAADALERVRAEQRALRDGLQDANDDVASLRQQGATLSDRLETLPGRFVAIEERLDAVQGGSFDARATMLRSEAEYYLTVANTELVLAGHFENAVTALTLADDRLAEIANPEFAAVREAISGELQALRGLRLPDIEGIVYGLGRLARRAAELPLRAEFPVSLTAEDTDELEAEPGFSRLWLAMKRTVLDLVRVERRDEPVPQMLSVVEQAISRRQLELELELARIAALRGDEQAFRSGLETASAILSRDFDGDAAEVEGALALLAELKAFNVAPERPDISRSLNLLREQRSEGRP